MFLSQKQPGEFAQVSFMLVEFLGAQNHELMCLQSPPPPTPPHQPSPNHPTPSLFKILFDCLYHQLTLIVIRLLTLCQSSVCPGLPFIVLLNNR